MRAAALIISVGMLHWLPAGRSAWIPGGVAFDPYQIKGQHAAAAAKEISQRKCSGKPAADGRFQSAQQETLVEYFRLHTDPDLPAPGSKDDGLPTAARKQPRVFCFAFFIGDHREQARALAETWMPRCDGALIHASVADPSVPTVRIPHDLAEEKESAHQMVRTYWKYIHDNYLDDFDYFLFGPEDYYTIVVRSACMCASTIVQGHHAPTHAARSTHPRTHAASCIRCFFFGLGCVCVPRSYSRVQAHSRHLQDASSEQRATLP